MRGSQIYSACFSPESVAINMLPGRSSGLFPVYCLPILRFAGQWPQCKQFRFKRIETHSYGDSAGITPDFPFNPALAGTRRCKCKGVKLKIPEKSVFICGIKIDREPDIIIRGGGGIVVPACSRIDIIAQAVSGI